MPYKEETRTKTIVALAVGFLGAVFIVSAAYLNEVVLGLESLSDSQLLPIVVTGMLTIFVPLFASSYRDYEQPANTPSTGFCDYYMPSASSDISVMGHISLESSLLLLTYWLFENGQYLAPDNDRYDCKSKYDSHNFHDSRVYILFEYGKQPLSYRWFPQ